MMVAAIVTTCINAKLHSDAFVAVSLIVSIVGIIWTCKVTYKQDNERIDRAFDAGLLAGLRITDGKH